MSNTIEQYDEPEEDLKSIIADLRQRMDAMESAFADQGRQMQRQQTQINQGSPPQSK